MSTAARITAFMLTVASLLLRAAVVMGVGGEPQEECADERTCLPFDLTTDPSLTAEIREALGAQWVDNGLAEHASVASFSRFSLQLMSVAAPAALVEAAHLAAIDEINHAKLCFGLAAKFTGKQLGPGPFPIPDGVVEVATNLREMATSVAVEGCIGETMSVVRAAAQISMTDDPSVRKVLTTIATDEARHAGLAWKTVRWAYTTGSDEVKEAIRASLNRPFAILPPAPAAAAHERDQVLLRYGVLSKQATRELDIEHREWLLPGMIEALTNGSRQVSLDYTAKPCTAEVKQFVKTFLEVAGFSASTQLS